MIWQFATCFRHLQVAIRQLHKIQIKLSEQVRIYMTIWKCTLYYHVCVYLCVYVFIPFHCKSSIRLQRCPGHTWVCRSTILCWGDYTRHFCPIPLTQFPNLLCFTSNNEIPERKRYDKIYTSAERLYILI